MSRPRKSVPRYLEHKRSCKGRLVWTDTLGIRHEKLLPGLYQSQESLAAKARLELELATSPTQSVTDQTSITVNEVLLSFLTWAATHYRTPTGEPTTEIGELKWSIRPVKELYGETPAVQFGPRALAAVRQHMIELKWCRTLINRRIDRVNPPPTGFEVIDLADEQMRLVAANAYQKAIHQFDGCPMTTCKAWILLN
jgi:hypothetical protein